MAIVAFLQSPVCALVHRLEYVNGVASSDSPAAISACVGRGRNAVRLPVHSGTAPFTPGAYSYGMQLISLKTVLATVWVLAVLIAGLTANLNSLSSWAFMAGIAVLPPIVLMWRWNAPRQTMSESIQEARR
jgi:hypothetical protein